MDARQQRLGAQCLLGGSILIDVLGVSPTPVERDQQLCVLYFTGDAQCDKPLRLYVCLSVVLSSPVTLCLGLLPLSHEVALAAECTTSLLYLAVVCVGTYWTDNSLFCQSTAPALWWWCFVNNSVVWTLLVAYLSLVVVLGVATAVK